MVTPEHVQMGHFRSNPCTMAQIHPIEIERATAWIELYGVLAMQRFEATPLAMELDSVQPRQSSSSALSRARGEFFGWLKRWSRWEFWPPYLFYPPVVAYNRLSRNQVPKLDAVYGG